MASDAAQLRAAFTKFDTNLSGAISLEDFVDVMTRTGRDCRPTSREQAVALFQRFPRMLIWKVEYERNGAELVHTRCPQ